MILIEVKLFFTPFVIIFCNPNELCAVSFLFLNFLFYSEKLQ